MDADLDLLLTTVFCTADDLLPERPGTPREGSQTRRSSRSVSRRRSWASRRDRRFLAVAGKRLGHLFPRAAPAARVLQASPPPGRHARVADGDLREPEPGLHRRPAARSTRRRSSAPEAARRSGAPRSATPPTTAGAPATRRYFWGFRLHAIFAPDGTPRALSSPRPRPTSAKSRSRCSRAAGADGGETCSATRATPAATSPAPSASWTPRSSRPRRKDEPGTRTAPRADPPTHRDRSSGPAKTSSPSNATAPARSPASTNASSQRFRLPRRGDHPQPPTRPPKPRPRRLLRLTAWNQSSSRSRARVLQGIPTQPEDRI